MSGPGAAPAGAPLRVLHFIDNLGPGGKERQLLELLKGLEAQARCDSLVVSMTEGVYYPDWLALRRATLRTLIRRSRKDLRAFAGFYRLVREFQPDLVVVWDHLTAIYALPATLLTGVAVVNAMIRDAPMRLPWPAWSRARLSFPFCDFIVANSQAGLDAYGVRGSKGQVVPNGIDTSRMLTLEDPAAVRRRLGLGDALVVGMVATFRPWKDQPTLIRAAGQILRQRQDVIFIFIGEGEMRRACEALVPQAQAHAIRFLGGTANGLESIINVFDIGVLATCTEGCPNAVMEYMALGKPVVASDGGGTRELLLDGETGYLVPAGDAQQLTERLCELLDAPALRHRLGEAGRRRVLGEYSLERMVERQFALYSSAAQARPRRQSPA